jgi:hypothetical protein
LGIKILLCTAKPPSYSSVVLPKGDFRASSGSFDGTGCRIVLRSVDWKIDTMGMQ